MKKIFRINVTQTLLFIFYRFTFLKRKDLKLWKTPHIMAYDADFDIEITFWWCKQTLCIKIAWYSYNNKGVIDWWKKWWNHLIKSKKNAYRSWSLQKHPATLFLTERRKKKQQNSLHIISTSISVCRVICSVFVSCEIWEALYVLDYPSQI